jgi:galactokinase
VTENARVLRAANALASGSLETFGQLMYESHQSLNCDFDVSCHELDTMVRLAANLPGTYGARMTGGGFGGCTVNLVQSVRAEDFRDQIRKQYFEVTGIVPDIYITKAANGAGPAE